MADFLQGRDQALADLEAERSPENWLLQQLKGAFTGVTNPFGVVGSGLEAATRRLPEDSAPRRIARESQDMWRRWEDEAPYANTAGALSVGGRGVAGILGLSPRNTAGLLGSLLPLSPVVRNVGDVITGDGERRKEQQRAREYGAAGY